MRIKDEDMQRAMFVPDQDILKDKDDVKRITICFTTMDNEDCLVNQYGEITNDGYPALSHVNNDKTYAQMTIHKGRRRFYVKQNKYGRFMNPVSGTDDELRNKRSQLKYTGHDDYPMREVSNEIFMSYIQFLKTKNVAFLHQAERFMQ